MILRGRTSLSEVGDNEWNACTDTDYFARRGRDAEWKDPRGEN